MKKTLIFFRTKASRLQIFAGVTGLLIGSLVYIVDRPPDQTYFVYKSSINISLYNTLPNLFGPFGNSVPSFIHVFSFILLTAGLGSFQKRGCLMICLCWFLADCAFELGQEFDSWPSMLIPNWFEGIPFLENTRNQFLLGTFDILDMLAISIGTVIAHFFLLTTKQVEERK
jgi:hypothetical protein